MSQKKQLTGGQKALRVLAVTLGSLAVLVLLLLVGVRAYFPKLFPLIFPYTFI